MSILKENYTKACNAYLKAFCNKHDFPYEPDCWVGDDTGTIAMVGDYFFDLKDIRYDIDNACSGRAILEWYDYEVRIGSLGCPKHINFASWVKGAPLPYTEENLKEIERLRGEVREAERRLEECIENMEKDGSDY